MIFGHPKTVWILAIFLAERGCRLRIMTASGQRKTLCDTQPPMVTVLHVHVLDSVFPIMSI